jgi:hypothetical protein
VTWLKQQLEALDEDLTHRSSPRRSGASRKICCAACQASVLSSVGLCSQSCRSWAR